MTLHDATGKLSGTPNKHPNSHSTPVSINFIGPAEPEIKLETPVPFGLKTTALLNRPKKMFPSGL